MEILKSLGLVLFFCCLIFKLADITFTAFTGYSIKDKYKGE